MTYGEHLTCHHTDHARQALQQALFNTDTAVTELRKAGKPNDYYTANAIVQASSALRHAARHLLDEDQNS